MENLIQDEIYITPIKAIVCIVLPLNARLFGQPVTFIIDLNKEGSISWCNSKAYGLIYNGSDFMLIDYEVNKRKHILRLSRDRNLRSSESDTLASRALSSTSSMAANLVRPFRRGYSTNGGSGPYYVKIVTIWDSKISASFSSNITMIRQRSQELVNIVNGLYKPLDVIVTLMDVIVWSKNDQIQYNATRPDITLQRLQRLRAAKYVPMHENYTSVFLVSESFENQSIYGFATLGTVCNSMDNALFVTYPGNPLGTVAAILAHEIGHILNMDHDNDCSNECTHGACIMKSNLGVLLPQQWSHCSRQQFTNLIQSGYGDCLLNPPDDYLTLTCGNGIVEGGEECDCGQPVCNHACCIGSTCKLTRTACCGSGPCCNMENCEPYKLEDKFTCRNARGPCDIAEICQGNSEFCPEDHFKHDGLECSVGQIEGTCYSGRCNSRKIACDLHWKTQNRTAESGPICYERNSNGELGFDCGYDPTSNRYIPCVPDDRLCGRLQCDAPVNTPHIVIGGNLTRVHSEMFSWHCLSVTGTFTVRDPGMTPDGSPCGPGKVCLNSHCTNMSILTSKNVCPDYSCSGHGICDNKGYCHCQIGFTGPVCSIKENFLNNSEYPIVSKSLQSALNICRIRIGIYNNISLRTGLNAITNNRAGSTSDIAIITLVLLAWIILLTILYLNHERHNQLKFQAQLLEAKSLSSIRDDTC